MIESIGSWTVWTWIVFYLIGSIIAGPVVRRKDQGRVSRGRTVTHRATAVMANPFWYRAVSPRPGSDIPCPDPGMPNLENRRLPGQTGQTHSLRQNDKLFS